MRLREMMIPAAFAALIFAGCNKAEEPTAAVPPPPPGIPGPPGAPPAPMANASTGQQIFFQHCVVCHGPNGKGTSESHPNFTDAAWQAKETDAELIEAVTDGHGKMPAFKEKLTAEQIADVVKHVRSLAQPAS